MHFYALLHQKMRLRFVMPQERKNSFY